MSRYIDADETLKRIFEAYPLLQKEYMRMVIDSIPTADGERGDGMKKKPRTTDITFCNAEDCPSRECSIKVTNNLFAPKTIISIADFRPECRFYIGWILNGFLKDDEERCCDRNLCMSNEYSGISCDECEANK